MKRHERRDLIEAIHDHTIALDQLDNAWGRCAAWIALGYPTSSSLEGTRSAGPSDPVGQTVASGARDDHFNDLRDAARRLREAESALAWLERFVTRYTTVVETDTEPVCASCARLGVTAPEWRTPREVEGVPVQPLCRWCYDFALAEGCWPPRPILRRHHDGKRITAQHVDQALGRRRRVETA